MGLDMYLKARLYIGGWNHGSEAERSRFSAVLTAAGFPREAVSDGAPYAGLEVCVAYWRKANAIHRWFVENVQEGEDDCRSYYVGRDKLEELVGVCRKVLAVAEISEGQPVHGGTSWSPQEGRQDHFVEGRALLNGEAVAEILPTASGFFFGSTDYDEWYLQDVEETIEQIERTLRLMPDQHDFEYRASW